jgi:hypothetical protein
LKASHVSTLTSAPSLAWFDPASSSAIRETIAIQQICVQVYGATIQTGEQIGMTWQCLPPVSFERVDDMGSHRGLHQQIDILHGTAPNIRIQP